MMRFASLTSALVVVLAGAAFAAEGDDLTVTGDGVNVRARPETGAPILRQVDRAEPVIELGRQGAWVQVRLPDRDTTGWIHGSLLATVTGAPAVEGPSPTPAPATAATAAPAASAGNAPVSDQAAAGSAPRAALGDGATDEALAKFRKSVTELNDRALAAAGVDLFTDVRALGSGVVQVTATDAWSVVPEGGQQSFMNALFGRWQAAAGSGNPLRVEVVDESGQVLSEQSGP